jgi:arginine repressor
MAKRSSPKTDLIREYLATYPTATATQIVEDLSAHGVSRALAAKVKSRYGSKSGSMKRGPKPRAVAAASPTNGARGAKANAIRDVAQSLPRPVRPRDVRASLAAQGIDVTFAQVSQVLKSMGLKRKKRRRKSTASAASAMPVNSSSLNIEDLVAAKKVVAQIGSIGKVKDALAALARLS